jgi:hypothetical protein
MGLFESVFFLTLDESFDSTILSSFFDGKKKRHREARHRRPIILDPFKRKHAQTVPDMHKAKHDIIYQVEKIKNNPTINVPLNTLQLREICKKFGINTVTKDEPKKLGNTGIMIVWDNNSKCFFLKK